MLAMDIMPAKLITAGEDTSLAEAARLMRSEGIGDIVITGRRNGDQTILGIVTDRDIVVHAVACDLHLETVRAADLCTRPPVTVDQYASLIEITEAMKDHGVRRVIVTSEGRPEGIVSVDDVIGSMAEALDNINEMLKRQIEYEQEHLVVDEQKAS